MKLLIFNLIVAAVFYLLLFPLKRLKCATYAVLKRNFIGYFSNPTGYVFICVFMLLSSIAAFWPDEFFNSNLATLGELNRWFPMIMLVFIPAITMSAWSEERREGTDELLLTIPASDVDIVLGKYLASVAIFTVALFFSQITNFLVLYELSMGELDVGLFIATYVGYWFIGIAMIALGMAASFLTSNLTVGFILGALFNAPLVFLLFSDRIIPWRNLAQTLSWWSYSSRFDDFGRGVLGLASIAFFIMIAIVGVYFSIILIGRRHWLGGRDGKSMLGHYLVRGIALLAIALGASRFFANNDWFRHDATTGKVSSLSPDTRSLLRDLDSKHAVQIEAFISRTVPEQFIKTKVDLTNMLREFEALAGADVHVNVFDKVEPYTEEATQAEEKYGIVPQTVMTQGRGTIKQEELFMGAAFTCGLERVVIPFFDRGIPVEYELVRSINTVANNSRRKLGVLKTDANMFGGMDMSSFQQRPKQAIIRELEKQYEVEEVDPTSPIVEGDYDVLLAVQPSSLTPNQLSNLITAVQNGQPTAIFEDPFPAMVQAPGTGQPKRQMGGPFGGGHPPQPKGDIRQLWNVLGVEMIGEASPASPNFDARVIWQKFNPYEGKVDVFNITPEWVFLSPNAPGAGAEALSMRDPVTSGLTQILMLYPGGLRDLGTQDLEFTPIMMTGDESGEISYADLQQNQRNPMALNYFRKLTKKRYIAGARIRGEEIKGEDRKKPIHTIYVADIDLLSSEFLAIRAQPDSDINWEFDNVTLVLNILDSLAGDEELLDIRKRKTRHSTLKRISQQTEVARGEALEEISKFKDDYEGAVKELQTKMQDSESKREAEIAQMQAAGASRSELMAKLQRAQIEKQRAAVDFTRATDDMEQQRDRKLKQIEHSLEMGIRKVQTSYKLRAAFIPLIPPLAVAGLVWVFRRKRERERVQAARLR